MPDVILVLAGGPIADALVGVGSAAGFQVEVVDEAAAVSRIDTAAAEVIAEAGSSNGDSAEPSARVVGVVVGSHRADEIPVLEAALRGAVPYVGLIANRRRGQEVVARLAVAPELAALVHTPAGLDIGSRTPPHIAVSIVAQLISLAAASTDPVECVGPKLIP